MFNNIGEKVKGIAHFSCFFGIISSVIVGITLIAIDEGLKFAGLLTLIFGSLFSWIGSCIIYAIGFIADEIYIGKAQTAEMYKMPNIKNERIDDEFINEIKNYSDNELQLIVDDQKELYSAKEMTFIKNELLQRKQ